MAEPSRIPQLGVPAYDPFDLHLQRLGIAGANAWSRVSSQTTLLLVAGIVLGPQGLAVLTPGVLALLQPAIPVALAVLGVTTAFGPADRRALGPRVVPLGVAMTLLIVVAVASRPLSAISAASVAAQAGAIGILLGGAGWLLPSRGATEEERRVFSIATLLLLGGVADYLSVSGVLLGYVAVSAWRVVRPRALAEVRIDAAYVQHPVTALLLVMVGAQVRLSWPIAAAALAVLCGALAVVLALGRTRLHRAVFSGSVPLTPSAVAVALVMDMTRLDDRLVPVLSVVVLAALTVDAFALRRTRVSA
jgi:hypothetical protein